MSTETKEYRPLSKEELNKMNSDEAFNYTVNLLNSIPGLKYGHIYTQEEKQWINDEYTNLKNERIKNNSNVESEYETKLRYHLSLSLPNNTIETIPEDIKKRIETPNDIRSSWAF